MSQWYETWGPPIEPEASNTSGDGPLRVVQWSPAVDSADGKKRKPDRRNGQGLRRREERSEGRARNAAARGASNGSYRATGR